MFDPTKPVQTRDGREARILATDGQCEGAPLIVELASRFGGWMVGVRRADGTHPNGPEGCPHDLVNVPEKRRLKGWVNVYPADGYTRMNGCYATREIARQSASLSCLACKEIDIEYTVGEGLEHE